MPHDRMLATRHTYTWIQKYIFPGGLLPSVTGDREQPGRRTPGCGSRRATTSAPHYAQTLGSGASGSTRTPTEVAALGFDEVFRRMWEFYLGYCEAGFARRLPRRQPARPGAGHDRTPRPCAPPTSSRGLLGARRRRPPVIRAWDGSEAGPAGRAGRGAPVRRGRCAGSCGARASSGSPGPTSPATSTSRATSTDGLRRVWGALPRTRLPAGSRWPRRTVAAVHGGRPARLLGPPPPPPAVEARLHGRLHSRARDRAVIAHHYDLSERLLRAHARRAMAYSCAYWTATGPSTRPGRRAARQARPDLPQARARPGQRLLDVGCGWGSLTIHAARALRRAGHRRHAVRASSATSSGERAADLGLDRVDVRLQDYRDAADGPYDAIASIEMGEHVGAGSYPAFCAALLRRARARAAGSWCSRCREAAPAGRRPVHRGLHRARHAHAAGRRDRRPARSGGPRGARRPGDARALRADRPGLAGQPRGASWAEVVASGRRARPGCGGSTWSAARSRSRRAGWASTRSWPADGRPAT